MTGPVVFDIEAASDREVGLRLLGQREDAPDADVKRMLGESYARDGQDPTTAFAIETYSDISRDAAA